MQIQFDTDRGEQGSQQFAPEVEVGLPTSLGQVPRHLTRIEVHLRDLNAGKGGDANKHCQLEARVASKTPISVGDSVATFAQAVQGAAEKLRHAQQHTAGRLELNRIGDALDRHDRRPMRSSR